MPAFLGAGANQWSQGSWSSELLKPRASSLKLGNAAWRTNFEASACFFGGEALLRLSYGIFLDADMASRTCQNI